jgi:GT2 family glycosyltransferase
MLMVDHLLEKAPFTRSLFTPCRNPNESGEAEHLAGACLLARREALDAIGLFDEAFHYYFEDVDVCYRLRQAGWRVIYLAEARVVHHGSASFNELSRSEKDAIYFKSLLHYFKKHSSPAKYIVVRLTLGFVLFVGMFERAIFGLMRRRLPYREVRDRTRASLKLLRSILGVETGRDAHGGVSKG